MAQPRHAPGGERHPVLAAHRFSSDDFLAMIDRGIIGADDRVELIDGEVISMSPSGPRHAEFVDRLVSLFADLHDRAQVRVQGSLRLSEMTVVDPDLLLLSRRPGGYPDALPGPSDVLLLIEVAEASLLRDREVKAGLYARHSIRDYWIVNLAEQSILVHRQPAADGYTSIETTTTGVVTPLHVPDKPVAIERLFG